MRKLAAMNFVLLFLFIGCKKDNNSSSSTEVEYQVTASNYSQITIAYNNENEQYVSGSYQTGWKYSFKTTKKPFTATIRAVPFNTTNINASVSGAVKILVNGNVVKSENGSGTGSADIQTQYVIQ